MKHRLFTAVALALLAVCIFGGSAMASDTLESLSGTWVEVDSKGPLYTILIDGNKITISWPNKVIYKTIFRLDGNELKNTKKRENWREYAKADQYEQFGHFEKIEIMDSKLVGFIFIADRGYRKIPFEKRP